MPFSPYLFLALDLSSLLFGSVTSKFNCKFDVDVVLLLQTAITDAECLLVLSELLLSPLLRDVCQSPVIRINHSALVDALFVYAKVRTTTRTSATDSCEMKCFGDNQTVLHLPKLLLVLSFVERVVFFVRCAYPMAIPPTPHPRGTT